MKRRNKVLFLFLKKIGSPFPNQKLELKYCGQSISECNRFLNKSQVIFSTKVSQYFGPKSVYLFLS